MMLKYIFVSRILVSAGQYALPTGYSTPETSRALANFWDTVNENYAHIRYGGHLESTSKVVRGWQKGWLHRLPSSVRTVAEYGIGAGLLGQVMLQNYSIAHYVGIDISRRQLGAASKRLEGCCQHRLALRSRSVRSSERIWHRIACCGTRRRWRTVMCSTGSSGFE